MGDFDQYYRVTREELIAYMHSGDDSLDFSDIDDLEDIELEPDEYPDCVCMGGNKWGHYNEAGGYCCPHWGNTCGWDHTWH